MASMELKQAIAALTEDNGMSFQKLLEQGYEALEEQANSQQALACWQDAWSRMKEILAGLEAKPGVEELDVAADGKFCMDTWLFDVCRVMLQEERYEELSVFSGEIMKEFVWTEESARAFEQMSGQKADS